MMLKVSQGRGVVGLWGIDLLDGWGWIDRAYIDGVTRNESGMVSQDQVE